MSSSSEIVDSGRLSGVRTTAEKSSNFSQTCNLLSQYLKEKGSLNDLGFGRTCGVESNRIPQQPTATTMNLFPVAAEKATGKNSVNIFGSTVTVNEVPAKSQPESAAPMTIFYGGQVLVFNDCSDEKAKEIMLMANSFAYKPTQHSNMIIPLSPNVVPIQRPIVSDLPIARKASLTRFLEKRKDRITARSPYAFPMAASPKPMEAKSWLGLAAADSPVKFEN